MISFIALPISAPSSFCFLSSYFLISASDRPGVAHDEVADAGPPRLVLRLVVPGVPGAEVAGRPHGVTTTISTLFGTWVFHPDVAISLHMSLTSSSSVSCAPKSRP